MVEDETKAGLGANQGHYARKRNVNQFETSVFNFEPTFGVNCGYYYFVTG